MNKNNRMINIIISIGIVCLIISLVIMLNKLKKVENHIITIDYDTYSEIINKDEYSIILLTSPYCDHCKAYKPKVNSVANEYHLTIYELDTTTLNMEQSFEIHDNYSLLRDLYDNNGNPIIRTPATIIMQNGMEVDMVPGDAGYKGFADLLKNNEIIK